MSTSLAAFQRKEAKAAADAARAAEEERRVKDAIRQEEAARKKRLRAHCVDRYIHFLHMTIEDKTWQYVGWYVPVLSAVLHLTCLCTPLVVSARRCCKVRGCTRLVLLLVVLGAFLAAVFYFPTHRRFGKVIILPVGAVFFVACLVAILEVRRDCA